MKTLILPLIVGFGSTALAPAVLIPIADLDGLTPDYHQVNPGTLALPVGTGSGTTNTFSGADAYKTPGVRASGIEDTDVSNNSAIFRVAINGLTAHGGGGLQWLFESGGAVDGVGLAYNSSNQIVFAARGNIGNTSVNPAVTVDATPFIGGPNELDIVASIELGPATNSADDLIRLYFNGVLVGQTLGNIADNDWAGGNAGAFGFRNDSTPFGATGGAFTSGTESDFRFYHNFAVPDGGSTLALLGSVMAGVVCVRRKIA